MENGSIDEWPATLEMDTNIRQHRFGNLTIPNTSHMLPDPAVKIQEAKVRKPLNH